MDWQRCVADGILPEGVAGMSEQARAQGGHPVHCGVERGRVELPAGQTPAETAAG